jgi:hypothetical protein
MESMVEDTRATPEPANEADNAQPLSVRRRCKRIDWWFRHVTQWFAVTGTSLAGLFFLFS